MRKIIILLFISIVALGCSNGVAYETEVTIVKVVEETGFWDCGWRTTVKTDRGFIDIVCNDLGVEGDKVRGYWNEGHHRSFANGFHLSRANWMNIVPHPQEELGSEKGD